MSVAPQLQEVVPFFMQTCPLCQRSNRMCVKGVYRDEAGMQIYPDMGFSFCNCKNIFYTRFENLSTGVKKEDADPVSRMCGVYLTAKPGEMFKLVLPDPFFCEFGRDPYTNFFHWNPRQHWIIWSMEQFRDEMEAVGFEVVKCAREFDIMKEDAQQTFEIIVKKPVEGK